MFMMREDSYPVGSLKDCVFVNPALKIQCHVVKISATLLTGYNQKNVGLCDNCKALFIA